jgi:hypothetical protein
MGAAAQTAPAAGQLTQTAGVRYFHGCYSIGEDRLWGVVRSDKSAANPLAALRSIRAARPDGDLIYVI